MKRNIVLIFAALLFLNCSVYNPTEFSKEALSEVFISLENREIKFEEILAENKGKKIVIDVWASWCKDCLVNLPDMENLQNENPNVVFLYLSLDRNLNSWKEGVERLEIKGQHYFMQSGWEGDFGKFLGLSWIPRYIVINEEGEIVVFNATKATDNLIFKSLKK